MRLPREAASYIQIGLDIDGVVGVLVFSAAGRPGLRLSPKDAWDWKGLFSLPFFSEQKPADGLNDPVSEALENVLAGWYGCGRREDAALLLPLPACWSDLLVMRSKSQKRAGALLDHRFVRPLVMLFIFVLFSKTAPFVAAVQLPSKDTR